MLSDKLLAIFRRRLRDVDTEAPLYDDQTLWGYVDDAMTRFSVRKVAGFSGYTVDADSNTPGITPDPPDDMGMMLALSAAAILLRDLYNDKVGRGEIGVSWTSGFESESTIDTRRAYDGAIKNLEQEVEELTLIRASSTSGTRVT